MRKRVLLAGLLLATSAPAQPTPAADELQPERRAGLLLGAAVGVVAPFIVLGAGYICVKDCFMGSCLKGSR